MPAMTITVKLFAVLRDETGVGELRLELPGGASVGGAVAALAERYPAIGKCLSRTARAVNLEKAGDATVLRDGDELALLPPVSGG
jgi:molybdopterin converting factor small subunit